jgi:hypothetical protein
MSSLLVNLEAAANTYKLTFFLPELTNVSMKNASMKT